MKFFVNATSILPLDCVITGKGDTRRITFVLRDNVAEESLETIWQQLHNVWSFSNPYEIVIFHPVPDEFLKNFLTPVKIISMRTENKGKKKTTVIYVASQDRGKVIGRKGSRITNIRALFSKYFGIDQLVLER